MHACIVLQEEVRRHLIEEATAAPTAVGNSSQLFPWPVPTPALPAGPAVRQFQQVEEHRRLTASATPQIHPLARTVPSSVDHRLAPLQPHPAPPAPHRHYLAEQEDSQHIVGVNTKDLVPFRRATDGGLVCFTPNPQRPRRLQVRLPKGLHLEEHSTTCNLYHTVHGGYLLEASVDLQLRLEGQQQRHRIPFVWRGVVNGPDFS